MEDIEKIIDERLSDLDRSKREELNFFAAHAPEQIPGWFKVENLELPEQPKYESEVFSDDEKLRIEAESWRKDPIYDLDESTNERLREFAIAWKKHWSEMSQFRKNYDSRRFFAWRWYYAKMMIQERPEI